MLTSQMALVSLASNAPLILKATTASSIPGLRSAGLPRRPRYQQSRGFRFGFWASYLDPTFQKELHRRSRIIKHKYAEALHRKLSWDRHNPVHSRRWGFKGLMCSSWRGHDPRPGGRWVNVDELRHMKENLKAMKENLRPMKEDLGTASSRGIEDVEQNALDHLFGRQEHQKILFKDSLFGWTWANTSPNLVDPATKTTDTPGSLKRDKPMSYNDERAFQPSAMESSEMEYVIDPITNRKVFQNSIRKSKQQPQVVDAAVSTHIPVKTFKGYRSQFSQFEPKIWDAENEVIHLDGKRSAEAKPPIHSETQKVEDELEKYTPYRYNEPDGKFPEEKDVITEGLMDFDHQYKPFKYNEPDGKFPEQPDSVSESLNDFDHVYKPFKYNEPDGKFPEQPNPASQGLNDSSHQYKPYKYNEPDGKLPTSPDPIEDGLSDYDRQTTSTISQNGEVHSSGWLSQEKFASDGSVNRWEQATAPTYTKVKTTSFSANQPSYSRLATSQVTDAGQQEDLDLLRASDIRAASGILKKPKRETQAEKENQRTALEMDFDSQGARTTHPDEAAAAESIKEHRRRAQELEIEHSYLLNHNAHARSRVNAKIAEIDAELPAGSPSPVAERKYTGNFVRDFPEEFKTSWGTKSPSNDCLVPKTETDPWGYDKAPKGLELSYQDEVENTIQSAENDYAAHISSQEMTGKSKEPKRLETSLQRSLSASKAESKVTDDPYSVEPQGLETSFAEEKATLEDCNSPMFTSSYGCENKQKDKALVREIRDIYESAYGTIDSKHRQILGREAQAATSQGERPDGGLKATIEKLEGEVREAQYYINDRYMDVAKAWAKEAPVDGASQESHKPADSGISTEYGVSATAPEPTLYKILAYDPIMQTINFAETTSIVPDTSSALTPAEVLLRLSNPSKFFPHFKPLQSQGYEIVSGSGDVLVFRKVRDAAPPIGTPTEPASISTVRGRKVVNPIDGMQSITQPDTSNFSRLSPTGFVNHDLPSETPFVSGIDVRREEPVFSGRGNGWQDQEDSTERSGRRAKKTGRGLLIGAAWVAACSYAVGVVAEFFKTGGSDGKGPVGF